MQVVFHLGTHFTDNERLIQTLANDPSALATVGGHTPFPRAYRETMREALAALQGEPADPVWSERLRLAWSRRARGPVERLIFSFDGFLAAPEGAIGANGLYPRAAEHMGALANLFPGEAVEFHIGLLNPAVLLAGLVAAQPERSYEDILAGNPPQALRWGPVVERMADAAREIGAPLIVWCNEDLPLISSDVVRRMGALAPETPLIEEDAYLAPLMSAEGMARLRVYLGQHPQLRPGQRRRVLAAFLDKFARPEAFEVELPLPDWDATMVDEITQAYDADVTRIAALEGITLLVP